MTFTVDSDLNGASPQFTLTCISTGGPATTVTWTRDSDTVTEGTETVLDDRVTAQYNHTLTVTGRLGGLYTCTVANDKPSNDSAQLNVLGIIYTCVLFCGLQINTSPAPSPPSGVGVSQNGLGSVLVSWTPPSGEPAVTGYIIYYQQHGGQRLSQSAGPTATTAAITGLMAGANYSITIVVTSTTLPSNKTEVEDIILGMCDDGWDKDIMQCHIHPFPNRTGHHLPHYLSLLPCHGWRHYHSHLLCHSAYWSNWYSRFSVGGAWSNSYPR